MSRARATFTIDGRVRRAVQVAAARRGMSDSRLVEEALRAYLGLSVIDRVRDRSELPPSDAEDLVYRELHASLRD